MNLPVNSKGLGGVKTGNEDSLRPQEKITNSPSCAERPPQPTCLTSSRPCQIARCEQTVACSVMPKKAADPKNSKGATQMATTQLLPTRLKASMVATHVRR